MKRKITVVDLFCGGGGESTGIHQAAMLAGYDIKLTAVILCAADYGAHTSRRRLFIQAVKGRKKILWPDITHTKEENNIFQLPPWKPSLEIIDWTIPIPSIFSRKKPLAPATIRRIEYGIRKYWREATDPFLAVLYKMGTTRNIDSCPPTKTVHNRILRKWTIAPLDYPPAHHHHKRQVQPSGRK